MKILDDGHGEPSSGVDQLPSTAARAATQQRAEADHGLDGLDGLGLVPVDLRLPIDCDAK